MVTEERLTELVHRAQAEEDRRQFEWLVVELMRLARRIELLSQADWARWRTICRNGGTLRQRQEDRLA